MAKFNYVQEQRVKVWERYKFSIEAETREEADKIAREMLANNSMAYDEDIDGVEFDESETLYETLEPVTVEECGGACTMRILRNDFGHVGNDLVGTNNEVES